MGLLTDSKQAASLRPSGARSEGLLDPPTKPSGLSGLLGEYLRRSGRNLGMGLDAAVANATANNQAIRAGADATRQQMRGQELTPEQQDALHNSPIGGFGPENLGAGGAIMGTYAGIGAKTANKAQLAKAKSAIAGGMDPETARQQFGWFQDPAGDWKFEISDHRAELRRDPKTARDTLHHPDLRRAYPDLVDTLTIDELPGTDSFGNPNPVTAAYFQSTNTAKINNSAVKNQEEKLSALLHELQHGVQGREGFSPGTNQSSDAINHLVNTEYWPKYDEILERTHQLRRDRDLWTAKNQASLEDFHKAHPNWASEYDGLLAAHRDYPGVSDWTFNKYKSALGEVEARDTQARRTLKPHERRAKAPYKGEGVPQDQIWDVRDVMNRLYPRKAADETEPGLLTPEQKGMIGSLLGLGLFSSDAE